MNTTTDIIFNEQTGIDGLIGVITLNRVSKLNCLTLAMLKSLKQQLTAWEKDNKVKAVIIKSASDKAFCAGGDVRALYDMQGDIEKIMLFFTHEYMFNKYLYHFNKPYIALLDGITMGGGCGISIHGSHPIATEKLALAMPETKIGLFPDVGMSYRLSRCQHQLGWYFGLSARSMDAATALDLGLIKAVITSSDLVALEQALLTTPLNENAHAAVDAVIAQFAYQPQDSGLHQHYQQIAKLFAQESIEDLMKSLDSANSNWANELLTELRQHSPLSLKLTFEYFKRAYRMSFDEVIQQDLNLVKKLMQQNDFFIGVKSLLINKDQAPHWQYPNTLAVPNEVLQRLLSNN